MTIKTRTVATAFALFLLLPTSVNAHAEQDVRDLLRAALTERMESEADAVALSERLVALGGTAVPDLMNVAAHGLALEPGRVVELPPLAYAAVVEALGLLPKEVVRAHLWICAREDSSSSARLSGLRILGTIGAADDVGLMSALVLGPLESRTISRERRSALASSLAKLMRNDERAAEAVRLSMVDVHEGLLADHVDALASPADRKARIELERALGVRPDADALIYSQIAKLVKRLGRPDDLKLESSTLVGLNAPDARTRTHAALLAKELDLVVAVPRLLELSKSSDQLERQSAAHALRAMLNVALPADGSAWPEWSEQEELWWEGRGYVLLEALDSEDPAQLTVAIRELSLARLHRDLLVPRIAPFAFSGDASFRRLAVGALGSLGGREAEDALVELLAEDPLDEGVRIACLEALRTCTALDLGEDPAVWAVILEIRRR